MLRGHGLGFFFFPFSVSLPFKMIWDKLGLRGCWKSLQDIGTSGCFWKSGGWRELLCVCGGLAPVSPPGQRSWSPLILYEGVLRHWRGPQPGGLQRHSLLPATFPARCGPGECGQQPRGPPASIFLGIWSFHPTFTSTPIILGRWYFWPKPEKKPNAIEGNLLKDVYCRLFVVEKWETTWMPPNIEVVGK